MIELEKENEQLKCDLYNTEANLQGMTINCENLEKENEQLKQQIEQLSNDNHVLKTAFITQQEQIDKLKCCYNCKYGRIYFVKEIIVDCLVNKVNPNNKYENCDKWELAE